MNNPSKIEQPKLGNPLSKKNKGNLPYLKHRKKLRKNLFR